MSKNRFQLVSFWLLFCLVFTTGCTKAKAEVLPEEISKKYAEQIVTIPGVSLILESKGGKNGGYRLSKSPSECTVGEIIHAAEGSLSPVSCIADGSVACDRRATCAVMSVWQGLDNVINEYLDGITLQDLLDEKASFDGGNDYVI